MSIKAMNYVWDLSLEPASKLILLKLADNTNEESGLCCPSKKLLAEKCCISLRSVNRKLIELRDAGLISWVNRSDGNGKQSNLYTICQIGTYDMPPLAHPHMPPVAHPLTSIKPNQRKEELFEEFWKSSPKKQGKKGSRIKFLKLKPEIQELVVSNVKSRSKKDPQWLNGYAPNPTTYLNGERWDDEWKEPSKKTSGRANPLKLVQGVDY